MRSKANVLWLSGVVGGAGGVGGARAHDVDVNAVYAAHRLDCEADTAVNIVGADRGVMGFWSTAMWFTTGRVLSRCRAVQHIITNASPGPPPPLLENQYELIQQKSTSTQVKTLILVLDAQWYVVGRPASWQIEKGSWSYIWEGIWPQEADLGQDIWAASAGTR